MEKYLLKSSVNFFTDALKIGQRSKGIKKSYDTMRKLVQVRPGFTSTAARDAHAVARDGRLLDGYLRTAVNKATGETEKIYYAGSHAHRTLYNANNQPVGSIVFDWSKIGENTEVFVPRVFVPGEGGKMLEIAGDGAVKQGNWFGITDFFKAFDFGNIRAFK